MLWLGVLVVSPLVPRPWDAEMGCWPGLDGGYCPRELKHRICYSWLTPWRQSPLDHRNLPGLGIQLSGTGAC